MSKWMRNKEQLFKKFVDEKNSEKENTGGIRRNEIVWKTPEKGTTDRPNIYQLRFLMDTNDNFYRKYHYHMYYSTSENKWIFVLCNKTFDFSNYCPFCAVVSKLYLGSADDKRIAYNFKRKTKYCCNAYIIKDPRDVNKIDEEKSEGNVLVYEFPGKVESKIKQEQNDTEYGAGMNIYDPGKDGFDFILKVGATKPIQDQGTNHGKTFPDYADSKFMNKPTPLSDSDDVIDSIMNKRHDLNEYINTMKRSENDLIDMLKTEMLYDLIKNEYEARQRVKGITSEKPDSVEPVSTETSEIKESDTVVDISESSLLAELDNL